MQIIKGKIESFEIAQKFDDDGIEYKQYAIRINKLYYTSKLPKGLYLVEGVDIIAELNPENPKEIIAGYCPINKIKWGKNAKKLSKLTNPNDIYQFVQGTVLEKRKSTSSNNDFSRDTLSSHTHVAYQIFIDGFDFHSDDHIGKKIKPGMEIAAVLEEKSVHLLLNKKTGKIYGKQRPYFILLFLVLVSFNVVMYYVYSKTNYEMPNFNTTLIVINIFLVLFWLMSIYTFFTGRKAMNFLKSNLSK